MEEAADALPQGLQRHEPHVDHLRAQIHRGEHEAADGLAGTHRPQPEALLTEDLIHAAVRHPCRDQLERHKEQERVKDPAHRAECGEPLADREVIHARRLERREILRVDRHRLEAEAARGAILDLQPDRLDAPLGNVDPEQPPALGRRQHRDRHPSPRLFLGDGAVAVAGEALVGRVGRDQQTPEPSAEHVIRPSRRTRGRWRRSSRRRGHRRRTRGWPSRCPPCSRPR